MVQDEEKWLPSSQSLLLHRHHKLGHFFFYKLQIMASKGDIPREVIRCCIFLCSACLFGKATKRAWRTKGMINRIHGQIITKPGDCVLVDQLQSPILVFVRQMKGWLTQVRYDSATVLVDNYSGISYVHVQSPKIVRKRFCPRKPTKHGVVLMSSMSDTNILIMATSRRTHSSRQSLNPRIELYPIVVLMQFI